MRKISILNQYCMLITCILFTSLVQAQNFTALEEYVRLGLRNNHQLIRDQLDTEIQRQVVLEAKGKYLPDIFLDASYTRADGGRLITVPAGDLINPAYEGLNQVVGTDEFPTNIPNINEQLLPDDFHETKIRLIQPILNTDIYYNRMAQEAQLSAREAKLRAYQNQLIKQIKVAYYQHLSAQEQVRILITTRDILEEVVRVSKKQVANDKATKEVIYGAQAELSKLESQIASAEKQEKVSRIFFNYLISRELEEEIIGESNKGMDAVPISSKESLTTAAIGARNELKQIDYGLQATRANTLLTKSYMVPEVSLVGDIGFQGFGYTFDSNQDFIFLRIGLTWPIFQGNQNKAKIQQSVLREKQLESQLEETRDLISLEVAEAYYAYEEALKTLAASQSELRNAEENFRIIQKKYVQNQVIQVAFNDARNTFTTSQLQEVISWYNLKIKQAELEAATAFNDFQN